MGKEYMCRVILEEATDLFQKYGEYNPETHEFLPYEKAVIQITSGEQLELSKVKEEFMYMKARLDAAKTSLVKGSKDKKKYQELINHCDMLINTYDSFINEVAQILKEKHP